MKPLVGLCLLICHSCLFFVKGLFFCLFCVFLIGFTARILNAKVLFIKFLKKFSMLMAKYFSTGLLFVDVGICIYREIKFLLKDLSLPNV